VDQKKQEEKKLARQRQAELEHKTKFSKKNVPSVRYNSFILSSASNTPVGDLEGLKVSHAFDTLDEGDSGILMLKDSRIISFQS